MKKLNKLNLKNITEDLIETFLEAGRVAKEINHQDLKITVKSDKSPVTNGDLAVNKILCSKIKEINPDVTIISEETVNLNAKFDEKNFWLIDPIDGTREYIKKGDEYTLNAALIINLKPAIGIIYAPEKNRLFFSYGKNLAFEINNGEKKNLNCKRQNINEVIGLENSADTPAEVLTIYKRYKVTQKVKMSSSLKFCTLAAGEADIYATKARAFEWDIAAGHAILEHAGGSMFTFEEKNFLYGKKGFKNLSLIAKGSLNLKK